MHEHLAEILKFVLLTVVHLGSTYFAILALFPAYALPVVLIAVSLALLAYIFLLLTDSADRGLPVGLLYFAVPTIYLTAGGIWWVMRLVGLWPPRGR